MKKYIYILIIFCFHLTVFSQRPTEKKADVLFEKKFYLKAAEMYEQLNVNQNILQNLGDCYYYNSMMNNAARVYANLFATYKDSVAKPYYFRYAQALMGIIEQEKADVVMSDYLGYDVSTPKFIANLVASVPYKHEVKLMATNNTNGDFGMSIYGDKVVFASYRNRNSKDFGWNSKPYLDLYSATVDKKGMLQNVTPFPPEINSKTHESNATFSQDGCYMYFNRTNSKKVKVGEEEVANIKIYRAEFIDGKWANIEPLPFCSDQFSCEHPVLSKDGKNLYFSSDMPGTIGSFDIFVVAVNEDGTFSTPKNLGEAVNTIHREQFPEISNDGTILYFASDGHQGLGGLDLFVSKSYKGVFAEPINLGASINGSADDFAYVVDENKNKGYFSSNRKSGDNLYSFTRVENGEYYLIEGEIKDKNTQILLPGAKVSLYDKNNILIGQKVVGTNGQYAFNTEPNTKYRLEAVKDFYIPHSEVFTTNDQGKLRYTIELFMECYDDAEEVITKRQDGKVQIVLENIYFDFNKLEINPDAAKILDVLIELLNKYPEMYIEIDAHTDSRASASYNLMLSDKRAKAALEYLVKNGIDRKRLKSKGFGESEPLIKCGEKLKCTEQEHSINRRCEFIILK